MAVTGKGDFPFSSSWLRNKIKPNRATMLTVYPKILPYDRNTASTTAWRDWFFNAATTATYNVYFGDTIATTFYAGSTEVTTMYVGTTQLK